jgi:hypothetical protein
MDMDLPTDGQQVMPCHAMPPKQYDGRVKTTNNHDPRQTNISDISHAHRHDTTQHEASHQTDEKIADGWIVQEAVPTPPETSRA